MEVNFLYYPTNSWFYKLYALSRAFQVCAPDKCELFWRLVRLFEEHNSGEILIIRRLPQLHFHCVYYCYR